jgi:thioredoxin-related protein
VAKPVVDRLAKQVQDRAGFISVNVATPTGLDIVRMYGVRATPTLLVFDGEGRVVYSHVGVPDPSAVAKAVESLETE